ncbi:MAG: LCP family protein [Chloroflexota bacterium]
MKRQQVIFHSRTGRTKRTDWRLRALIAGFAIFIAGGLYFGYVFLSIAVEMLELQTGADLPNPPAPPLVAGVGNPTATPGGLYPSSSPKAGERINILLLGLDQRPADAGIPSRTDTMIVATIEPRTQTAALLSIPRDLWAAIPTNDGQVIYNKINTGHFWGQDWGYPDGNNPNGGPDLAKTVVEYNLGIPIHYYARIDFKGFEKAVDLLDGIDINVPKEIVDPKYPLENDTGTMVLRFEPGLQHMDGVTALQYARTRNADSDFGRMSRQRQVLMAVRDKALQIGVVTKLPQLIGLMRDSFDTDMPLDQMLNLANIGRNIKPENVNTYGITPEMVTPDEPVVGALLPRQEEVQKLISEVFFDPALKEEAATVELQNGTMRDGLAGAWGTALQGRGFTIGEVRQADASDYAKTEIIDYTQKQYTVNQLATLLHVSPTQIRQAPRPAGSTADVCVIFGNDALTPPS